MLGSVVVRFGQVAYGVFLFTAHRNFCLSCVNDGPDLFNPWHLIRTGDWYGMLALCLSGASSIAAPIIDAHILRSVINNSKDLSSLLANLDGDICAELSMRIVWAVTNLTPFNKYSFARKSSNYLEAFWNLAITQTFLLPVEFAAPRFVENHMAAYKIFCCVVGMLAGANRSFIFTVAERLGYYPGASDAVGGVVH